MADRVKCQGCGRLLVPLRDGTARNHSTRRGSGYRCPSSGYRLARWTVGQKLRHHTSGIWVIDADLGGEYGDYEVRCLTGVEKGRVMVAHGEYMHRHGWTPIGASDVGVCFGHQRTEGEAR